MDIVATLNEALEGRYRIEREIGAGGMATVYLAQDLRHNRHVAIKVLRPDLAATVGTDRFLREIEIAAQLQHPHILPLLDSGEHEGLVFYVMPYVEGASLAKRLSREGELPINEALRITIGIVDALVHAHAHDVVHRDVKPDNVMMSGRHPFVTDFGVARALSEATQYVDLTTMGVALGTPSYMSPEQAAADPHVDHRADLYSVGVVAYEMLTGAPPFTGNSPQKILAAQVTQTPAPVSQHRPGVSAELEKIVMRCLEKRAANRWQTAAELLTTLEGLVTPSGGSAPTSAALPAARKSRPTAALATAGVVVLAVAAFAFGWISLPGSGSPPLPTLGQSTRVTTGEGLATHASVSPDGTLVAYSAGAARAMRVYIQPVGGGRTIALSEDSAAVEYQPRWSPDGSQILFLTPDGLHVASSLGGTSRLVAGRSDEAGPFSAREVAIYQAVNAATWAPDGERIFLARGGALSIATLSGGPETELAVLPTEVHSCKWSPDGRWIACTSGNGESVIPGPSFGNLAPSVIQLIDPFDGSVKDLTPRTSLNEGPVWAPDSRRIYFLSDRDGTRDVYALDLDKRGDPRGEPRRITTGLGALSVALDADGSRLIYVAYSARGNAWSVPIRTQTVNASSATQLTIGDQLIESTIVSPDGRWLVYDSNRPGNADIFRIPVDGGAPEQLTDHPADDFAGELSPDGTRVAFHSWRTGTRDIFVRSLDGHVEQLTDSPSQESYPIWSADGSSIYYFDQLVEAGVVRGLYKIEADASGAWGEPVLLREDAARPALLGPDSVVYSVGDASIEVMPVDGGEPRVLYVPDLDAGDPGGGRVVHASADGSEIYFKATFQAGEVGIWSIPRAGGSPRLRVRFDDLDRSSIRPDFGVGAGRFFFTLEERRSTVWVVELTYGGGS